MLSSQKGFAPIFIVLTIIGISGLIVVSTLKVKTDLPQPLNGVEGVFLAKNADGGENNISDFGPGSDQGPKIPPPQRGAPPRTGIKPPHPSASSNNSNNQDEDSLENELNSQSNDDFGMDDFDNIDKEVNDNLPDATMPNFNNQNLTHSSQNEASGSGIFKVKGIKKAKFLGFLPVSIPVESEVSEKSGSVLNTSQPLWAKLFAVFIN